MPTPHTIQTPEAAVELTDAEKLANQLVNDSDLTLQRLINAVSVSFHTLWGGKERPTPKDEAQAVLDALGADGVKIFQRHGALVAFLEGQQLATFEPWEKVPAYTYTLTNGKLTLSDLAPEWTA